MKFIVENKNKIEARFKFKGQSTISQRWLDFHFDWIGVNFSTRESDFNKQSFQIQGDTQNTNTFKSFKCQ